MKLYMHNSFEKKSIYKTKRISNLKQDQSELNKHCFAHLSIILQFPIGATKVSLTHQQFDFP